MSKRSSKRSSKVAIVEEIATLPFDLIWHILSIAGCLPELLYYNALYCKINHKHATEDAIAKGLPEPKRPSWFVDNAYLVGKCLMARGPYGLKKRVSALMSAARLGHHETVKLLLDAGADKEARCYSGNTALMTAAHLGQNEVVKLLLDAGADKDSRDFDGKTSLTYAVLMNQHKAVKILLDAGADKKTRDNTGKTALMSAVDQGYYGTIKLLSATVGE